MPGGVQPATLVTTSEVPPPQSTLTDDGMVLHEWVDGDDVIVQASGQVAIDLIGEDVDTGDPVEAADGSTRWVMPVGDWVVGSVQVRFYEGECPYVFWLPAGTTEDQAREFVRSF